MNIFVIQAQVPEVPVLRIYQGIIPFLLAPFVLLILLVVFPGIALWLPNLSVRITTSSHHTTRRLEPAPPARPPGRPRCRAHRMAIVCPAPSWSALLCRMMTLKPC